MNHLLSSVDITDGIEKKFKSLISKVTGNIYIISIKSDLLFTHSENEDTYNRILKFKNNVYLRTIDSAAVSSSSTAIALSPSANITNGIASVSVIV